MKLKIISEITLEGIGKCNHEHVQEFADDSNVFELIAEYRKYMKNAFPNAGPNVEFKPIKAERI